MENLNERQKEAVRTSEGFLRIIAGAGSGKTRVLVNRYRHLLTEIGCNPRNILCVTFTAKAAESMQKRIKELIGEGFDTTLITTYHGFCVRVLREDGFLLGYPKGFMILDETEMRKIIREINEEKGVEFQEDSVESIIKEISDYKCNYTYVSELITKTGPEIAHQNKFIEGYLQRQKQLVALDFNDLINFTLALFEFYPLVLEKWSTQLEYIMVDEFQDSTNREMQIIDLLSRVNANLMVVGDPDQNIYEWRGSRMELLVAFDLRYPKTKTIVLEENYRSVPKILDCANSVISHNSIRVEKNLFTRKHSDFMPIFYNAKNQETEVKYITDLIKLKVKNGRKYQDIAIIYRASYLSRAIETALMNQRIPYELVSDIAFFERSEIKDIISYLKLINKDPEQNQAFKRIINMLPRKFGRARMKFLIDEAEEQDYFDFIKTNRDNKKLINEDIKHFIDCIDELRIQKNLMKITDFFDLVLHLTGYEKYLIKNQSLLRLENLAELKRYLAEFDSLEEDQLSHFLKSVEQKAEVFTDRNKVKLMTIHASKGLEFPVVFITGMQDGIFPSARVMEERKQNGLEEERRIFYVALTRAEDELYLTNYQTESGTKISRFIKEMGKDNYLFEGQKEENKLIKPSGYSKEVSLKENDEIAHPLFGQGIVKDIDFRFEGYKVFFPKTNKTRTVSFEFVRNLTEEKITAKPKNSKEEHSLETKETLIELSNEKSLLVEAESIEDDSSWINYILDNENKSDWRCINIIDLNYPSGLCQLCQKQYVRYLHVMKNNETNEIQNVGCVCAGKLEGNSAEAKSREKSYKNIVKRLETFLNKPWKTSSSGNQYRKIDGEIVTIIKDKYQKDKYRFYYQGNLSDSYSNLEHLKKEVFFKVNKIKS
ncbi:MAG: ATP-dependent helicase [Erysipelotrichales bacterium]|nr:ATP-dependent helicase [Erysipelotrichales bacterium]